MRIISVGSLREFWTGPGRDDAEQPLRTWVKVVKAAEWSRPTDVKKMFRAADILPQRKDDIRYRRKQVSLVVAIHCRGRRIYVRFIGTHKEYDKVDARTV